MKNVEDCIAVPVNVAGPAFQIMEDQSCMVMKDPCLPAILREHFQLSVHLRIPS